MKRKLKVKLEHILTLPPVWAKLMGKDQLTRKGRRKLTEIMAERHARMSLLERCGVRNVDVGAFYDVPPSPKEED